MLCNKDLPKECNPPKDCLNCGYNDNCPKNPSKYELSFTKWLEDEEYEHHRGDIIIRIRRELIDAQVKGDSYGGIYKPATQTRASLHRRNYTRKKKKEREEGKK